MIPLCQPVIIYCYRERRRRAAISPVRLLYQSYLCRDPANLCRASFRLLKRTPTWTGDSINPTEQTSSWIFLGVSLHFGKNSAITNRQSEGLAIQLHAVVDADTGSSTDCKEREKRWTSSSDIKNVCSVKLRKCKVNIYFSWQEI